MSFKFLSSPLRIYLLFIFLLPLAYQNCGVFEALGGDEARLNKNLLVPETDRLDENCQNSDQYDVCIFKKSPVSQSSGVVANSGASANSLQSLQKYGVKLTGLGSAGQLKNDSIEVKSLLGPGYTLGQGKVSFNSVATNTDLEQLMSFYWMNRAVEYLAPRSEDFAITGQKIKVIVDDKVAGWNANSKTIHLKRNSDQSPMAFDGGILIHYLGQANASLASKGITDSGSSQTHRSCRKNETGCCQSAEGCIKAIASGASDYLVGVMFPDDPRLGESWLNRVSGAGFCGFSRDLNKVSSASFESAFEACSEQGGEGEVHVLGVIYASVWWEVRKKSENQKDIDQIYFRHLKKLSATDTFSDALEKIKDSDQELFSGKYSQAFIDEFSARGL